VNDVTLSGPGSLIHAFVSARTGMALSGSQRRRLDERLAVLRGNLSEQQYLLHLQAPAGAAELAALVSVVVVHKTDLFRDEVQLASFRDHVLKPLVDRAAGRPLRLWSAGCATGEEVATLLIMLEEAGADPGSMVLGTDISEPALSRARTMSFHVEQIRRLPSHLRDRYFTPDGARALLVPELRERASFQLHNLMETPYPAAGGEGFDVIFCRNVLIYFTAEAFDRVVGMLAERLSMEGTLVLSAAEPLLHAPPSLRVIRGEHAFFYVRTPDLMTAQPRRKHGDPFALPSSGRQAGMFAAIGSMGPPELQRDLSNAPPSIPGADWPRDPASPVPPASEGRRDSGRFATVSPSVPQRDSGRFAAVSPSVPQRDSGRFPAVPSFTASGPGEPARESGRFPAVGAGPVHGPPMSHAVEPAHVEADSLFALVLDGAGEGDAQTEDYLRRCLALDPELAAARYLLGMMLELREASAEALAEYRKALRSLEEGRARPTPFFLNHARLAVACARAVERMEGGGRPR
jgi:chemotaxis protein methyltransferase CheR